MRGVLPSFQEGADFISAHRSCLVPGRVIELGVLCLPCSVLGLASPPPPGHRRRFVGAGLGPTFQLLPPLGPGRVPHDLSEEDWDLKNKTFAGRGRHTLHVYTFTSWFLLLFWIWTKPPPLLPVGVGSAHGAAQACPCDVIALFSSSALKGNHVVVVFLFI